MSTKNGKAITFIKRNIYYLIFIVCLAVITTITVALLISKDNSGPSLDSGNINELPNENSNDNPTGGGNIQNPDDGTQNGGNNNSGNEGGDNSGDSSQNQPTDKPSSSVIIFDLPVNGTIIKEYVSAGVIYNQTLGLYTGHKAIDFAAQEGTQVTACYDGVIESITMGKLEGTTLTIDHGNGLKSVYNSIEVDEGVKEGDKVLKGDVLGCVSTNNRKEYMDGAHLHFEVLENGVKVDPNKYLLMEEK